MTSQTPPPMQLENVVPFGRSLSEYRAIFSLTDSDLSKSILSVADGPASFNAEGTVNGYRIQSCDPIYQFSAAEIRDRFYAILDTVLSQIEATPDRWVWTFHDSPATLRAHRIQVTETFSQDFDTGKQEGRYTTASLPSLPYKDNSFDLCLCSHFLFLYSEQFDSAFHQAAITELLRISPEVRIFPLLTLNQSRSPHIDTIIDKLTAEGHTCTIRTVNYELQPGGNQMLQICR